MDNVKNLASLIFEDYAKEHTVHVGKKEASALIEFVLLRLTQREITCLTKREGKPKKKDFFSKAEKRVLEKLMLGRLDREIADELFVAKTTVKFHMNSILKKTGAKTRYELIARISKGEFE